MASNFHFESMGIGSLLAQARLCVPPNQRPYAWEERHVTDLLQDLSEAITKDGEDYYLGTIVLIQVGDEIPSIADGQQRLATVSIILARIRDHQDNIGRSGSAKGIDEQFLRKIDINTEDNVPQLKLNNDDHEFYVSSILNSEDGATPIHVSNRRLYRASETIKDFLANLLKQYRPEYHADQLIRWVEFIRSKATIVRVTVPDEVGAFRMFETLNDRGLRASQADILKNYFFSKSGDRINEAQSHWSSISAIIEQIGDDDDDWLVTFLRHLWVTTHGPTKERELAAQIKSEITGENRTLQFLSDASAGATDYSALWSSQHPKWREYSSSVRQSIETIAEHLRVEQIRPLLFAVARHFEPAEAQKAFKLCVSWSVRFLIVGGRGGMLDTQYSNRAKEIGTGSITKARELRENMARYVPGDDEFQTAFAAARVSRTYLARYYLRAIEKTRQDDPQPEYVPNEDVRDVSLEHVMPVKLGPGWNMDDDVVQGAVKMLGNMVLLRAGTNRDLGNLPFAKKKEVLAQSDYSLTREVAELEDWSLEEIRERQSRLAALAASTWPLTFGS